MHMKISNENVPLFAAARNILGSSTVALDRHALVPALSSRDQADSLLLFAFPLPFFLILLSLVEGNFQIHLKSYICRKNALSWLSSTLRFYCLSAKGSGKFCVKSLSANIYKVSRRDVTALRKIRTSYFS